MHDVVEEMEWNDKNSKKWKGVKKAFRGWGDSDEVHVLEELDEKFMKSRRGKRMANEFDEFTSELEAAIEETENGIHIRNDAIDDISDELDDFQDEVKSFEKSKWGKAYKHAWEDAMGNKEARAIEKKFDTFMKSKRGIRLQKELEDVHDAIEKHVKVTDLPKRWEEGIMHNYEIDTLAITRDMT